MLLGLVFSYLIVTIAIGLVAARRVHNVADFAVAGRHLPLLMIITTTFATWFGSETVLGVPAKFIRGGMRSIVEDPFGSGMCLVLVGAFFAARLYRMNLLTLSDYYRERYGRSVELCCSALIMLSYLGWVAAQVTALGIVFNTLSAGTISISLGMVIGVISILAYTLVGGMWSVAVTDFIQMIILVVGLLILAVYASIQAGGAGHIFAYASSQNMFRFLPEPNVKEVSFFFASAITMMLGSIPQQDVFQRVMSAKDIRAATHGPMIGGVCYLLFAFVPIYLVVSAFSIMPEEASLLLHDDPQKILPTLIMRHMPFAMQVVFFGALLSAIKSCASATLLAPSVTFTENIWGALAPFKNDRTKLSAMRVTVLCFSSGVLLYAMSMHGTPIYELVSSAYQVTLVGAFIPLVAGLYWKKASTQGAMCSIVFGVAGWLVFMGTTLADSFPAQLVGLIFAVCGMLAGSLLPQKPEYAASLITHSLRGLCQRPLPSQAEPKQS